MRGYWTYYLAWFVLAWALQYPWLLAGAVVFFLLRRYIPDPFTWFRTEARIRTLRIDIAANPANLTSRRDLAVIYLQRLRPRAALRLLDEARQREPENPELLYLTGLARLRAGDALGSVEPLVASVHLDGKLRRGEPYLVAAEALMALRRWDDAVEALNLYGKLNKSSIEACVRLARCNRERGDKAAEKHALDEGDATWHQLPGFLRRQQWRWWLRGKTMRVL